MILAVTEQYHVYMIDTEKLDPDNYVEPELSSNCVVRKKAATKQFMLTIDFDC